jgi:phage-related tail fiber protein
MSVLLTVTGQNKFAAALAGGDPVNLTEFAVGDGGGDYYTLDESQTALVNETWRGDINRVYVDPTNLDQVVGEALIPAGVGGWTIREAGLFDADGDLIAVALYPLTEKPAPGSGSEKEIYARMVLQVTNGGSAVITVSQDLTMATLQDLADHEAKQLDPTDTDETREKHLSNAQAHGWEASIAANAQAVVDEATARSGADSTLQGNIDAEASTRAAADSTHANLTSPHSASSAATASRLIVRDASGRAQVAAPSAAADIARKDTVDAVIATLSNVAVISAYELNANYGYVRFTRYNGSPGPMIQWDNRFVSTTDLPESFTFAFAFPNYCSILFVHRINALNPIVPLYPYSWSQTGFTVDRHGDASGNYTFGIIAIGY